MGKLRKNNPFKQTMILNNQTFNDYLNRFRRIALSMFEWVDLPETMDSRYLEECLYYDGQAALLYDSEFGFINTKAADAGYINIYGLPTKINCYSYSYHTNRQLYKPGYEQQKDEGCILVLNNFGRTPTDSSLVLFANRLAEAQRTIDTNVKNQKYPVLLLTDDSQRLTFKNIYEQWDGNSPVIMGDKNILSPDSIKAIKTDAPYVTDKLMDYKRQIFNEALTFLGIDNIENEKKERLISAESGSNNELINMNLQAAFAPRQKACEEFNQKFGTNVKVKLRSDLHNVIKETESVFDESATTDLGLGDEDE